jgi:hypothetical protein
MRPKQPQPKPPIIQSMVGNDFFDSACPGGVSKSANSVMGVAYKEGFSYSNVVVRVSQSLEPNESCFVWFLDLRAV